MIQYINNTNLAYVDGYKFRKDKRGYWISGTLHKYLHQYIYEQNYGKIPKGYEIIFTIFRTFADSAFAFL